LEKANDSLWGQMDTMVEFSRDTVSKAQGFEEPEEPAPKEEEPPKPQLSKEEQEK
jgi:hypothetical protein